MHNSRIEITHTVRTTSLPQSVPAGRLPMRVARIVLASMLVIAPAIAQEASEGPKDEKAQKTYKHALEDVHDRRPLIALDDFKKADKQDGGRCLACQKQMIKYGIEYEEWKTAELATEEMIAEAQGERETALAHYEAAQG